MGAVRYLKNEKLKRIIKRQDYLINEKEMILRNIEAEKMKLNLIAAAIANMDRVIKKIKSLEY